MKQLSLIGRPIALVKPYAEPSETPIGGSRITTFVKPYELIGPGNVRVDEGRAPTVAPTYSPYLQGEAPNMERRLAGLTDAELAEVAAISSKAHEKRSDEERARLAYLRRKPVSGAVERIFDEAPVWLLAVMGFVVLGTVGTVAARIFRQ